MQPVARGGGPSSIKGGPSGQCWPRKATWDDKAEGQRKRQHAYMLSQTRGRLHIHEMCQNL